MSFFIYVYSGLNNKLIPLFSLLRIAKKENKIIKCYWGNDAYLSKTLFEFCDLFEPVNGLEFISLQDFSKEFNNTNNIVYNRLGSDRDRNEIIYTTNSKNSVFFKIVHMISYKNDNVIGKYVPYPREKIINSKLIDELRETIKVLKPKKDILNKINTELFENNKILGLHIRTTDGGFVKIPKTHIFNYINEFLKINPSYKIYISCDNFALEQKIIEKFPNKIYYLKNPFGNNYKDKFNRSTFGTKNAICEMFSLSKCSQFVGTPGSSFTFMVWLLRNENTLNFWCENPFK